MKINEIFYSIQGEGIFMGLPMAFVRSAGCNLRCRWCDTKYAYETGDEITIEMILARIKEYPTKNVCLTGGEPLVQNESGELIRKLLDQNYYVFLETNGSIFLGDLDLQPSNKLNISMDIKCPSSGEEDKMNFANLDLLGDGDQVKFIIADENDYEYAKKILREKLSDRDRPCNVVFTPCAKTDDLDPNKDDLIKIAESIKRLRKLVTSVKTDGLDVRVLPQLHKLLWPEKNKGV